jgi:hypothetical protein
VVDRRVHDAVVRVPWNQEHLLFTHVNICTYVLFTYVNATCTEKQ